MSKKDKTASCGSTCGKKTSIGGQALMEGIMMRGPQMSAMAVRNTEGEIVLEKWETELPKSKAAKLPIIRGVVNFIFSMKSGYKCLMRSAEISGLEELEREAEAEKQAKKAAKKAKKMKKTGLDTPEEVSQVEAAAPEELAPAPELNTEETTKEENLSEYLDNKMLELKN